MADANDAQGRLFQNLQDAKCSGEQIRRCVKLSKNGELTQMLFILRAHRKELLETIHSYQKALDSLDYLVFQTENPNDGSWERTDSL